jgi:hypothetical protein
MTTTSEAAFCYLCDFLDASEIKRTYVVVQLLWPFRTVYWCTRRAFFEGVRNVRESTLYFSRPSPTTLAFTNCFVRIW